MVRRNLLILSVLLAAAAGSVFLIFPPISAKHPALTNLPELVPLRDFYASSDAKWRFRLSPDGERIAWLEAKNLKPALWVRPLEGHETEIFHTDDEVRWFAWSADGRYLLYQADRDGWENDVIVSVDVAQPGAAPRAYDFGKGVKSWIHSIPPDAGNEILIGHNGRDPEVFDLYRLNLDSGEAASMALVSELGVAWSVDRKGEIYARKRFITPDDWRLELREGENWREILRGGLEDTFWVADEPDENGLMLAVSDLGRDKQALVQIDTATGREVETLFQHDVVDISWIESDPVDGRPLSVVTYPGFQERTYLDPDYQALMGALQFNEKTALHRVSYTKDMSKVIAEVEHPTKGWSQHLIDRETGETSLIQTPPIADEAEHLSGMEPVTITAEDGLTLHATLTRPKGVEGPAPMVIIIHGGPVARSAWGYSDLHNWMANRGYAVLNVNYRASAGFGRAFREAAVGEVSRKMHQDIVDARQWAVDEGIADPDNVAVFGGSFGGLKVLTALTQTPDLFAAGVDINGVFCYLNSFSFSVVVVISVQFHTMILLDSSSWVKCISR
ncbi:MAG: prolyl oligopeptidase family serine peptidase, partial [Pseudomonadota bacterium]